MEHAEEAGHVAHSHEISKLTLVAMSLFSIGYMISEPNLDGYNLEEALEYICNATIESPPVHIAGFITSFFSNLPLLAAILYCWIRQAKHSHPHEEGGDDHHHHSSWEMLLEFVTIGTPFALMGVAAYLDTLSELFDINALTVVQSIFYYTGAVLSGSLTGVGAYKLHGFHLHDAMEEHGGGILGFFKGLYSTFGNKVWSAHENYPEISMKLLAVINEAWKKYGIVGVHGFLGNFAADVFCKETGLGVASPGFSLFLKITLPMLVMMFEGNTEARSLDSYNSNESFSYSLFSKLVVTLSGILHTVPAITSLANLIGSRSEGPGNGKLYNTLIYLASTTVLAYPSVYGFVATTIKGYDDAAEGLVRKFSKWCYPSHDQNSDEDSLEDSERGSEVGLCSKLYQTISFWRAPKPESRYLVFGLDEKHPYRYDLV